ncbi:glycoside hydrolase family 2 TIM barrel-domain containing protein [Tenacibaculum sp. UWU-22]|uniref:glycoside hydrolase family 2 TIM barrel-domain containing protein n=1 Tax=Tenacibaculum sp. UWU-22 TaxID=3234187 RepID=UPI0034DB57E2
MVNISKNIVRSILIISYIGVLSIILFLISSLYSYLNTGADRSKILNAEVKKIDQYTPQVIWKNNEDKTFSPQTLKEIKNDYLDAWYLKHIAYKTNLTAGINDYYTKSARKNLIEIVALNKKNNISIDETTLKHNIEINFFSKDGQLAVLTDHDVVEYKKIYKNNQFVYQTTETATYKVILLLEDGFWRIRHLVKESVSRPTTKQSDTTSLLLNMKGINYYPQATPWDMFGANFNIHIIEKDFAIIKNAGLNTIRIFIGYEDFGKDNVKESKLKKLQQVLDCAEKNNLKVVVTLFDFYGNYEVLNWTLTYKHAQKIVSKFKNHPAILAWDVKNEPNLDFESREKSTVIAWLEHLITTIKAIDIKHYVTIGWSNVKSADILKDKVDFVSFHYYEDLSSFEKQYRLLKEKIPNKPIVLGEFGVSSYNGFWKPFGGSEKKQANYYKKMQEIIKRNNIPFMSWTLYDFNYIPKEVVGRLPWRTNPQKKFGFISKNGTKKPAFKFIAE